MPTPQKRRSDHNGTAETAASASSPRLFTITVVRSIGSGWTTTRTLTRDAMLAWLRAITAKDEVQYAFARDGLLLDPIAFWSHAGHAFQVTLELIEP